MKTAGFEGWALRRVRRSAGTWRWLTLLGAVWGAAACGAAPETSEPFVYVFDLSAAPTMGFVKGEIPAGQPVNLRVAGADETARYRLEGHRSAQMLHKQLGAGKWEVPLFRGPASSDETLALKVSRLGDDGKTAEQSWLLLLTSPPDGPAWRWPDEMTWIVSDTAVEVVELLYAATRTTSPPNDLDVEVSRLGPASTAGFEARVSQGSAALTVRLGDDPVWRPESYRPLAALSISAWGEAPHAPSDEGSAGEVLEALTAPSTSMIEEQSQKVSRWLQQDLSSPAAHESAALVLSALALREAPGGLHDVRAVLNRMTAHLAVATALRGSEAEAGLSGELAAAALLGLAGRQAEAVERLEDLERRRRAISPAERAWLRALRIRATSDWRLLRDDRARPTLLERLEHVRALSTNLGELRAIDYLERSSPEPVADWARILLARGFSVQTGNMLAPGAFAGEVAEAARVLVPGSSRASAEAVSRALRVPRRRCLRRRPGERPEVRVIDPGLWAGFFERHILVAAAAGEYHLREMLGLPEEAAEHRKAAASIVEGLPLSGWLGGSLQPPQPGGTHPWKDWDRQPTCQQGAHLTRMLPELVVPNLWDAFSQLCEAQPGAAQIRSPVPWFGNLQIPGTAYDLPGRGQVTLDRLTSPAVFADLHRLAPWSATAAQLDFIVGAHRAPEKFEEVFGPLFELNLGAMRYRASLQDDDSAAYLPLARKLCEVEPGDCLLLGYRLVEAGSDAEAVKAYERALAEADDRVLVSNNMEWLINHLAENGRVDRALEIAQQVGDVYSARGLGAQGKLLERLGRDDEALEIFRKMAARYERRQDGPDEFLTAYRHRVADGRYEPEAAAAEARVFPQGLTRVRSSDFHGPPPDGVRVTRDSKRLRQIGLAPGAIIVALDGYRVHTLPQYTCVRRFTYDQRMALIVYFQGRYLELKPRLPQRSFDATLESYPSDDGIG